VTTSADIASTENTKNLAARIGWTVLICATLYVCYFSHLGAIGFVGPDEPRYAWIARDMAETGDWVTPRLYGKPWFEKPPLYYWGAAICFELFGVSDAAARLPSAICALLATLAMAWLAWRVYRGETARWLLLLLPTTVGMIGFSHAAATDMPFSAMLTIAMVCAAVIVGLLPERPRRDWEQHSLKAVRDKTPAIRDDGAVDLRRWLALILFGLFLGLAVLAKGPAAIILCGGAVFFWALFTKRWRDALRLLHPAAIAASCVTALPWYILCARRNPDFFRIFIIEHNFKRYLTPEFQHIQPFWFYIPVILIAFLPWTAALLCTAVIGALRAYQEKISGSTGFLVSWALFCILFFSISQSKLPGYVLPAVPAIAILVSRSCTRLAHLNARPLAVTFLVTGVALTVLMLWLRQSEEHLLRTVGVFTPLVFVALTAFASFAVFLGIAFLLAGAQTRNFFLVSGVLCVILPLAFAERIARFLPIGIVSARYLAREIQTAQIETPNLTVAGLKRGTRFGLNFYLHAELNDWNYDPRREVYVLTEGVLPCRNMTKEMSCTNLWENEDRIDRFGLLHLVPK